MSLIIKRQSDTRVVKSILHRVADIPGGVTVSVATLGGATLFEGTPIGKGADGLFQVIKTAQIVTAAGVQRVVRNGLICRFDVLCLVVQVFIEFRIILERHACEIFQRLRLE